MTLLRPHQREELETDKKTLERNLSNPYIQDKGAVSTQLRKVNKQLEIQSPKPYPENEVDKAAKREKALLEELSSTMPSQEEMRKCPPGAIGKHRAWEKKNKPKVLEWKELRLRLNSGSNDPDIANLERYRPTRSTLNMDNALIPGKNFSFPSEAYKENYDKISWGEDKKEGAGWSEERRKAQSERMKEMHSKKKEAKKDDE